MVRFSRERGPNNPELISTPSPFRSTRPHHAPQGDEHRQEKIPFARRTIASNCSDEQVLAVCYPCTPQLTSDKRTLSSKPSLSRQATANRSLSQTYQEHLSGNLDAINGGVPVYKVVGNDA